MALVDQLRLMVITDPDLFKGRDPVGVCRAAVRGGATMIQVRWKDGTPSAVVELARALVDALPVPILVNDRVDIALAAGAAGAHLGWEDVPLTPLRPHLPAGFLLGISVGSADEAARAAGLPADYWSVGPCFTTPSKADAGPALGPEGFAALARLAPEDIPVIGVGGITAVNAPQIISGGAAGVAVIGAVLSAPDPESAARALAAAARA
ncbi:MAG: thiamine phosphate synthase [Gemmatimonadetes bacterium]|nr:MAG: thiamine phosphate synthase [Gemmatimonadota bacterium]